MLGSRQSLVSRAASAFPGRSPSHGQRVARSYYAGAARDRLLDLVDHALEVAVERLHVLVEALCTIAKVTASLKAAGRRSSVAPISDSVNQARRGLARSTVSFRMRREQRQVLAADLDAALTWRPRFRRNSSVRRR